MNVMKPVFLKYLPFLLFVFTTDSLSAQILDPVDWRFHQEQVSDNEVDLIFTAVIEAKWHLYSQELPEGGPIATSFAFTESELFERTGDVLEVTPAQVKYDPSFDMDLKMFSNEAVFKQRIRLLTGDKFELSGSIEYMCCDDERCLPPKDEAFTFTIPGIETPDSAPTGLQSSGLLRGLKSGRNSATPA